MRRMVLIAALMVNVLLACDVWAQLQAPVPPRLIYEKNAKHAQPTIRQTFVEVVLLTGTDGSALFSQSWRALFQELNYPLLIRRSQGDEQPRIEEQLRGNLRYVTAIAKLDRQGSVQFPQHRFTLQDKERLRAWLHELQLYGAQGSPQGQPVWGLSQEQFDTFHRRLATLVQDRWKGRPLGELISRSEALGFSIRWSTHVSLQDRTSKSNSKIIQEIGGFSHGTALALALSESRLGFRPERIPDGGVVLTIVPRGQELVDHWPVGWETDEPSARIVPQLFPIENISITSQPLEQFLELVEQQSQTPIRCDIASLDRHKPDWRTVTVQYGPRRVSWSQVLRSVLGPHRLSRQYRQDEVGRGFVWITWSQPEASPVKQ